MSSRRVLIVEHEGYIQQILTYTLRRTGLLTLSVGSAEEALPILHSTPVHCLVIDAELPNGKNGFELAEILRDDSRLCCIPFLFLSSSHHPNGPRRACELGAVAYITKPFSLDKLIDKIRQAIPLFDGNSKPD